MRVRARQFDLSRKPDRFSTYSTPAVPKSALPPFARAPAALATSGSTTLSISPTVFGLLAALLGSMEPRCCFRPRLASPILTNARRWIMRKPSGNSKEQSLKPQRVGQAQGRAAEGMLKKSNVDRVQSAKDKIAGLKSERNQLASKANKTPAD